MKMVILIMAIWIILILILLFYLLNQMEALITSLVMGVLKNRFFHIMFLILRQYFIFVSCFILLTYKFVLINKIL